MMHRDEILGLLFATPFDQLAARADAVRREAKGDMVHVRGIVEFSNHCIRNCVYCGLRRDNAQARRYRLTLPEVLAAAGEAAAAGADTVVLQSGDDYGMPPRDLADMVEAVKSRLGLAVTLSVGERPARDYALWRSAGADRFLMKHETADAALYARLHPGKTLAQRLAALRRLRDAGYEVGSGFIVGVPGQRPESLADDVLLVCELAADMCGAGPFVPNSATPLAGAAPGPVELTLRCMAVLRIARPGLNLPATTALATLAPQDGQLAGLRAGGNVLMPGFTPASRRADYHIYDHKRRVDMDDALDTIRRAGRVPAPAQGARACRIPPGGCGCTSVSTDAATSASRRC